MTQVELAIYFNITGIAIVLVVSLFVASRHPEPFFRHWTWAYMFGLGGMMAHFAQIRLGSQPPFSIFSLGLFVTAAWHYWQAARLLGDAPPLPYRGYALTVASVLAAGTAVLALGGPHENTVMLSMLAITIALCWTGLLLIRGKTRYAVASAPWLGWPLLLLGLWPLSYPLTLNTPAMWLGYWVSGVLHLFVGIGMVVFLLEETADRLRRKNEELLELDQLKNNFLSTVSHELRTPLTAVVGAAEVLDEHVAGPLNVVQQDMVGIITSHSARLERLIGNILDYTRMGAGKMSYALHPEDLAGLVAEAARGFAPAFDEKGVSLELTFADPELSALLDPERVTQVVVNLLSNALKFTPRGGRVIVSAVREGPKAVVRVADNGAGVPEAHRKKIFELFYQADGNTTRSAGGMGLGLAICKAIVEDGHGGRLWLEQGESGATFAFALPLAVAAEGARAELSPPR